VSKRLIAFRVKQQHYAELERIAKEDDDSISEVIRKAIESFLKKRKK
jgi:hypothetical protein